MRSGHQKAQNKLILLQFSFQKFSLAFLLAPYSLVIEASTGSQFALGRSRL